jgi:ubiquinone/menaquinone biosynthesis C-methylase UbiE
MAEIHSNGIKLDLGCGPYKLAGCIGIDFQEFPGVDRVLDLTKGIPYDDSSVSFINMSHFFEHVNWGLDEFLNEIYRVCQPEARIRVVIPYLTYWGGFSPGHAVFLSEEFFKENVVFNKLFQINSFDYTYSPTMAEVKKKFNVTEELARRVFWNVCAELIMEWQPKK